MIEQQFSRKVKQNKKKTTEIFGLVSRKRDNRIQPYKKKAIQLNGSN